MNKPSVVQRERYVITEPQQLYYDTGLGVKLYQVFVQRVSGVPSRTRRIEAALRRVFGPLHFLNLREAGSVLTLEFQIGDTDLVGVDGMFDVLIHELDHAFGDDPDPAVWGDALDALDVSGLEEE